NELRLHSMAGAVWTSVDAYRDLLRLSQGHTAVTVHGRTITPALFSEIVRHDPSIGRVMSSVFIIDSLRAILLADDSAMLDHFLEMEAPLLNDSDTIVDVTDFAPPLIEAKARVMIACGRLGDAMCQLRGLLAAKAHGRPTYPGIYLLVASVYAQSGRPSD